MNVERGGFPEQAPQPSRGDIISWIQTSAGQKRPWQIRSFFDHSAASRLAELYDATTMQQRLKGIQFLQLEKGDPVSGAQRLHAIELYQTALARKGGAPAPESGQAAPAKETAISDDELAKILIEKGFLTAPIVEEVKKVAKNTREPFGQIAIDIGYITEEQLKEALAAAQPTAEESLKSPLPMEGPGTTPETPDEDTEIKAIEKRMAERQKKIDEIKRQLEELTKQLQVKSEQEPTSERNPYHIESSVQSVPSEDHPAWNEDAFLRFPEQGAFAVFDGMGGHVGGEKGSRLARQYVAERIRQFDPEWPLDKTAEELKSLVTQAHETILAQARAEGTDMGTTGIVVKIWQGKGNERRAIIVNAGDSRVYKLGAGGMLEQITIDDDVLNKADHETAQAARKQVSNLSTSEEYGKLSDAAKALWVQRNRISQALGLADRTFSPREYLLDIQSGDKLIMTSDGIHDNLTDQEIAQIVAANSTDQAAKVLTDQALARSRNRTHIRHKSDDMTALVIEIKP